MSRNKKGKQSYHSMAEFEKTFFPQDFKRRMAERPEDAQALGIRLAKDSLEKIKSQLAQGTI